MIYRNLHREFIYLVTHYDRFLLARIWIFLSTLGVVLGGLLGVKFLHGVSELTFRKVLVVMILMLGFYVAYQSFAQFR